MPEVSIIVPIFNAEKYLNKCLDSIVNQTFTDFEVILIDDGSTDSSAAICQEYVNTDERFKYIFKKNGGVSSARNRGLDECKGNYIYQIDSDDWIDSDLLTSIITSMKKENADLSIFGFCTYNIQTHKERFSIWNGSDSKIITKEEALKGIVQETYGTYSWNKICKKELYKNIRFPENLTFCEDFYTTYKLVLSSNKILLSNKVLYFYRLNNTSSLTHNFTARKCIDAYIAAMDRFCNLKQDYPQFNDEGVFYIIRSAVFYFCHYDGNKSHKYKIFNDISQNCGKISKYKINSSLKFSYAICRYLSPFIIKFFYSVFMRFR